MQLNINIDKVVVFTNKLEKMHRSALPVAIRETLNSAAFDVKKNTMPEYANKEFTNRTKNFFKANSKVNKATGFDVNSMEAVVGFYENKLKNQGTNYAVKDLEQQEEGGQIGGRSFIPLKQARTSRSWNKNVKSEARRANIKGKIIDSEDNTSGRSPEEKYVRSAIHAGKGGWLIGSKRNSKGNRFLNKIVSVKTIDGETKIKSVPMFAVQGDRKVKVKGTGFMKSASMDSAKKMEQEYIRQAKRQIERLKNK